MRWLVLVVAPQLPALPERTCPLIRDIFGGSGDALSVELGFAAVGVLETLPRSS